MYDAAIGRTFQLDPHAENYYDWSLYSWSGNNPISNIDPTGMDWYRDEDGQIIQIAGATGEIEGYTWVRADETAIVLDEVEVSSGPLTNEEIASIKEHRKEEYRKSTLDLSSAGRHKIIDESSKELIKEAPDVWLTINGLKPGGTGDPNYVGGSFQLPGVPGSRGIGLLDDAAKTGKNALPALDATGKVHGTLPKIKDLGRYSKEELQILHQELKQSVQKRIKVTSRLGRDRAHGQRQGAEQDLIKAIEKHLQNRK